MRLRIISRFFSSVEMPGTQSRLPPLPSINDVVRLYRINALKSLSQNFLMEPRLHTKIVKAAGSVQDCHVCEVGPGPGGITRAILEQGAKSLIVVEKDERFLPSLELLAEASDNRMVINIGDIMHYNLAMVFPKELSKKWEDEPPNIHLIGNLPFHVSTFLIIKLLRDMSNRRGLFSFGRVKLTLTFQKEVAERMVAPVVSKQRCRLSVMCQHLCDVQHKFTISGKAFLPKPEVDVGVVHFVPLVEPRIKLPIQIVEKFLRHVFHHRQKYSRRNIETLFPKRKQLELTKEVFQTAAVDPTVQPFKLSIEELNRMCIVYNDICQRDPTIFPYDYRSSKSLMEAEELLNIVSEET